MSKCGFNISELADSITSELEKLQIWFETNNFKLSLNVTKIRAISACSYSFKIYIVFQLSFASSEVPGQLDSAVVQAEKCTKAIARFADTKEELNGDVSNHAADVTKLSQTLTSLTSQIEELEKYSSYLRCISRVDELRLVF